MNIPKGFGEIAGVQPTLPHMLFWLLRVLSEGLDYFLEPGRIVTVDRHVGDRSRIKEQLACPHLEDGTGEIGTEEFFRLLRGSAESNVLFLSRHRSNGSSRHRGRALSQPR